MTNHTSVILSWNQGKHVKTVPLNTFTNVAVMHSCPNFRTALRAYPSVVVSDDEDNEDNEGQTTSVFGIPSTAPRRSYHLEDDIPEDITQSPRPITFDSPPNATRHIIPPDDEEEVESYKSPRQLYQAWHHRLNHLSHSRMKLMIEEGLLPAVLKDVVPPKCHSCLLGRATRRPWRTKGKVKPQSVPRVLSPGSCVSVDQLQSTTPGLIAQLRGFVTKQRYHFATVFVDQYSSLGFVYLQRTSSMIETLKGNLREIRCQSRRYHPSLPRRQRTICRCRMVETYSRKGSNDLVLWYQRSPSERRG